MNINIRQFKLTDKNTLEQWCIYNKLSIESLNSFPETTYIAEIDGKPAVCLCLYLTICGSFAWIENVIGNPELKNKGRSEATNELLKYVTNLAKELNYKNILIGSVEPKLTNKYKECGYYSLYSNFTLLGTKLN